MNEKFSVIIYPKAQQDMEDIFDYISKELYASYAAINMIEKFEKAIDDIRLFPDSCPFINNDAIKDKEIRKFVVDNYMIFYK